MSTKKKRRNDTNEEQLTNKKIYKQWNSFKDSYNKRNGGTCSVN